MFDDEFDRNAYGSQRRAVVRFGAISEAWTLFTQRWGTWVLTVLVVLVCYSMVGSMVFAVFGAPKLKGVEAFRFPFTQGTHAIPAVLTMILVGFLVGGMIRLACLQVRGLKFDVGTLFSVTNVAGDLIVGSLLYGLATSVGFFLLFFPGLVIFGVLMFTIPLIVDGGVPPVEAVRKSWHALKSQWLSATLFHISIWFLSGLGACFCVVGLLATAPLYSLSIAVLYRDFFLHKGGWSVEKPQPYTDF
ncbi:hypothetical protein ACYOEI_30025 [Singulisphaera rosea]